MQTLNLQALCLILDPSLVLQMSSWDVNHSQDKREGLCLTCWSRRELLLLPTLWSEHLVNRKTEFNCLLKLMVP